MTREQALAILSEARSRRLSARPMYPNRESPRRPVLERSEYPWRKEPKVVTIEAEPMTLERWQAQVAAKVQRQVTALQTPMERWQASVAAMVRRQTEERAVLAQMVAERERRQERARAARAGAMTVYQYARERNEGYALNSVRSCRCFGCTVMRELIGSAPL